MHNLNIKDWLALSVVPMFRAAGLINGQQTMTTAVVPIKQSPVGAVYVACCATTATTDLGSSKTTQKY